jgi:hypothetical protein
MKLFVTDKECDRILGQLQEYWVVRCEEADSPANPCRVLDDWRAFLRKHGHYPESDSSSHTTLQLCQLAAERGPFVVGRKGIYFALKAAELRPALVAFAAEMKHYLDSKVPTGPVPKFDIDAVKEAATRSGWTFGSGGAAVKFRNGNGVSVIINKETLKIERMSIYDDHMQDDEDIYTADDGTGAVDEVEYYDKMGPDRFFSKFKDEKASAWLP